MRNRRRKNIPQRDRLSYKKSLQSHPSGDVNAVFLSFLAFRGRGSARFSEAVGQDLIGSGEALLARHRGMRVQGKGNVCVTSISACGLPNLRTLLKLTYTAERI